jgi:hypothetical protein
MQPGRCVCGQCDRPLTSVQMRMVVAAVVTAERKPKRTGCSTATSPQGQKESSLREGANHRDRREPSTGQLGLHPEFVSRPPRTKCCPPTKDQVLHHRMTRTHTNRVQQPKTVFLNTTHWLE